MISEITESSDNSQGLTDYDIFSDDWAQIFSKISELYADETIDILYPVLSELLKDAFAISISARNGIFVSFNLETLSLIEKARINFVLKDLRTFLRIFGQFSSLFTSAFEKTVVPTWSMVKQFSDLASSLIQSIERFSDEPDYISLCAESFGILQAYIHWLEILQQKALDNNPELRMRFNELCSQIVSICIFTFKDQIPSNVAVSSSKLFLSICTSVKPIELMSYSNVDIFMTNVHNFSISLTPAAKKNIYFAISFICLHYFPNESVRKIIRIILD
jgi:hypothetical protein